MLLIMSTNNPPGGEAFRSREGQEGSVPDKYQNEMAAPVNLCHEKFWFMYV